MDFVEEEGREAVGVQIGGEVLEAAGRKPKVVEACVEGGGRFVSESFAETLEHEGGLARAPGALDANEAVVPVDLRIEVAMEAAGGGMEHPVGGLEELDKGIVRDGGRRRWDGRVIRVHVKLIIAIIYFYRNLVFPILC